MTNPNVYQFIDENNGEHVYDEIKQMEGYKDPGEWQNLLMLIYEKNLRKKTKLIAHHSFVFKHLKKTFRKELFN